MTIWPHEKSWKYNKQIYISKFFWGTRNKVHFVEHELHGLAMADRRHPSNHGNCHTYE